MANWLVIDLEATTDEGGWPVAQMEIIEIGAVIADSRGQCLASWQSFVRPQRNRLLSDFCRTLTHIEQTDIDSAPGLPAAQQAFDQWLQPWLPSLPGWLSWGNYDRQQLALEWQQQAISTPLAGLAHHNLKQLFTRQHGISGNRCHGLPAALQQAGLQFDGSLHRALDDARNIARLLAHIDLATLSAAGDASQRLVHTGAPFYPPGD